jgi:hypothetical protein
MSGESFFLKFYEGILDFSQTSFFFTVKVLLGIYVVVLFLDLILLLIQRNVGATFREGFSVGMNIPPELTVRKEKLKIRWEAIKKRLETGQEKDFKVAIIEADEMIGDLVKRMGYGGENLGEIFQSIPDNQVESITEVRKAHEIKNRIVQDEHFKIGEQEVRETFNSYEKFLDEFEVFD